MTTSATTLLVAPDDVHNQALVRNVHPADWTNPTPAGRYNLVVMGAGTAGLVSAVGAASLGGRVAIVERHLMGGDCLNYGCVPSKALIRAARAAAGVRQAGAFGVNVPSGVTTDFAEVMARLRRLRAGISQHDSVARLTGLGIDVFLGEARFVSHTAVDVGGRTLRFARAVIATGARADAPPIPGLADAGFLTNETVFSLTTLPRRLTVLGAGPIGCELAQAFRRLGSDVTIIGRNSRLLPKDDPDAAAIVRTAFEREGIRLVLSAKITRVERSPESRETRVVVERDGRAEVIAADALLVAIGRRPNVEGLGLEHAGIAFDRSGVQVDDRLRTTNRRVLAAGDIASPHKFTHAADALARIALQNGLFFGRRKGSALVIPWATYTDPEVAHVGMSAEDAKARAEVRTFTVPFAEVDRAILDGDEEGFARVHADARGRILGATMVARHAGDMIGEISLAMTAGLTLSTLGRTIHPYPTQAEAWKKIGDAWNRTKLTPRVRSLFEAFLGWRR